MATKETYDTPIPPELRTAYDAWYRQLPENLQYTGDYDLQGAWLEKLGQPTKYEATQNGHLDDYGKKPNHPTFSSGSKWHDPNVPERTGGEWKKADDGTWDFYPGSGNQLSDEELERYFEKHEKGNRVHKRETRSDMEGGDTTGAESVNSVNEVPEGAEQTAQNDGGPRIVVNPKVFSDKRDALCVAMNEAFRILMEVNGFEPQAEPTPAQRRFFADTAYADDELMLRRTILARICTFDTSIGGPSSGEHTGHSESTAPTDEQLQEAVEFLETVMEIGAPQNQWEQQAVKRIHDVLVAALENGQRVNSEEQPEPPQDENGTVVGAVGGGEVNEDEEERGTGTTGNIGVQDRPTMNGPAIDSGRIGVQDRPTMNGPAIDSGRIGVQDRPTMNGPAIDSGRIGVQDRPTMNGPAIDSGRIGVQDRLTMNGTAAGSRPTGSLTDTEQDGPDKVVLTADNIGASVHKDKARQAAYAELITRGGRRVPR